MATVNVNPAAAQQGVVVQKPKFDVYATMLILAFVAIVIGIVMLAMEMKRYDWDIKASKGQLQTSIQRTADLPQQWV